MTEKALSLNQKLLSIQQSVDAIIKDGKNTSDKYDFASNENVVERFRPLLNQYSLLLIPSVECGRVLEGQTKGGTTRYLTELDMVMTFVDCESGETLAVKWYGQGVDLAGEKGVGKAQTYAEKYFLMKFFHVPTKKDDPDSAGRTRSGELYARDTQAGLESRKAIRAAIAQIVQELTGGDPEKMRTAYLTWTRNDKKQYAGVDNLDAISDVALGMVYNLAKKQYEKRTGKVFELMGGDA